MFKAIGTIGAAVSGASYASSEIQKRYPAQPPKYNIGDRIKLENGEEKICIGFTGHSEKVINNIDPSKGLYFGSRKVAQRYASMNGGKDGRVGAVFANNFPDPNKHYGAQTFEGGHAPVSKVGFEELRVKVLFLEEVNIHNREGLFGSIARMRNPGIQQNLTNASQIKDNK